VFSKGTKVGTRQRESLTMAVKAGVKMVFGFVAAVYPHGDNGKQVSRMLKFDMTPCTRHSSSHGYLSLFT
jgi:hypothetical protein